MPQLTATPPQKTEPLASPDWRDIQTVLRDSHEIWSSGLDKSSYYEYIWWQMHHRWSRGHYQYFVSKTAGGEVASSVKLYTMAATAHHAEFKIGGIGGVYTPRAQRGHGYAKRLLRAVHDLCRRQDYDAMLLYSDIDVDYYESLGYEPLGAYDFYIWLPGSGSADAIQLPDLGPDESNQYDLLKVDLPVVPQMVRHYQRWRENLPFAIDRSEDYWHYKLSREMYVSARSSRCFASKIMITTAACQLNNAGYALIERTSEIVRVLEVVGSAERKESLWRHILRLSNLWGIGVIRGWEGSAPNFIKGVRFVPRDHAVPMILPFNPAVAKWQEPLPCPLLELDHF